MRRNHVVMALLVFLSFSTARGQELPRLPRFYFQSILRHALPIADLPAHIDAPDGQLTLYADFKDIEGESITIYLVNRTEHRIGFSAQDGNPYLKLEAVDVNGNWERAQPHYHSWCGNSYMHSPSLRPGEFFKTQGWYPSEGTSTTVRYRIFSDSAAILDDDASENETWMRHDREKLPIFLVSNSGSGKIVPAAIDGARTDGLAPLYGSFETVRNLALGITKGSGLGNDRTGAIRQLGRFPTAECLELVLQLIHDTQPRVSQAAMIALEKMGMKLEAAEEAFQGFLMQDDIQLRLPALSALRARPTTPDIIAFAKGLLSDDELPIRVTAMSMIAQHCKDDAEIKAYINSLYDDPDPKIRSVFDSAIFPTCINYQERGRN